MKYIGLVFLLLPLLGCDQASNMESPELKALVQAEKTATSSFRVIRKEQRQNLLSQLNPWLNSSEKSEIYANKEFVAISTKALEKEFLLRTQLVRQVTAPSFNGLKTRVVAFRLRGQKLYLMEATEGHFVTDSLPANLLLAEFPVLYKDQHVVVFDFNKGMSQIFVASDWVSTETKHSPKFGKINVRLSYIEEALFANNALVIRQVAQVETSTSKGAAVSPMEFKYYLSPYLPDPTFKKHEPQRRDRFGYFEASALLKKTGHVQNLATYFHPQKDIVFAISANTPKKYKKAVREGILYWNKAFGEEKIKVIEAPAGVSAPDLRYNLVQWVEWPTAGFAYADAQVDPRSGQILNAQVFLTSGAVLSTPAMIRGLLRRVQAESSPGPLVSLKGFEKHSNCQWTWNKKMLLQAVQSLGANPTESELMHFAEDALRSLVAHEIGHTLGLRHNFAGSLGANYGFHGHQKTMDQYFQKRHVPKGLTVTSSVMDYLSLNDNLISGYQIAEGQVFDYDLKAIQSVYKNKHYEDHELPLYCTDEQVRSYIDCQRFDAGASLWANLVDDRERSLKALPYQILERYIWAKNPAIGYPKQDLAKLRLKAKEESWQILANNALIVESLKLGTRYLRIHRKYPVVNSLNAEDVKSDEVSFVDSEIQRLGGLKHLLPKISKSLGHDLYVQFVEALNRNQQGIGPDGKPYSFTAPEVSLMKSMVRKFMTQLQNEMEADYLYALANIERGKKDHRLPDHPFADEFAGLLKEIAQHYLIEVTGQKITTTVSVPEKTGAHKVVTLQLPVFYFSNADRNSAKNLLGTWKSEAPEWALQEKSSLGTPFKDFINKTLQGVNFRDLNPRDMTKKSARWVLQNRFLYRSL